MSDFIIIVCIALLLLLAVGAIIDRSRLRQFWSRTCTGRLWKRRFPQATKMEIRKFLELESFFLRLQDHYGVDLLPSWREDITLGDIFSLIRGMNIAPDHK